MTTRERVLVTGGAGFIGSRLVKALVQDNEVTVADSLSDGLFYNDVVKAASVLVKEASRIDVLPRFDVIYHLGMTSGSRKYVQDPRVALGVIEGTIAVFEKAVRDKSRVIYASTSSIYNGLPPPHVEDQPPKVGSLYAEARIAVERLGRLWWQEKSMGSVGLRLFCVYGEGCERKGPYANIVNRILLAARGMDDPSIYGDGSARRDFIHVDDVVRAFVLAKRLDGCHVINVGTGISTSLNDLEFKASQVSNVPLHLNRIPKPSTFPQETRADTSKAESVLGFRADIQIDDGLKRVWAAQAT